MTVKLSEHLTFVELVIEDEACSTAMNLLSGVACLCSVGVRKLIMVRDRELLCHECYE